MYRFLSDSLHGYFHVYNLDCKMCTHRRLGLFSPRYGIPGSTKEFIHPPASTSSWCHYLDKYKWRLHTMTSIIHLFPAKNILVFVILTIERPMLQVTRDWWGKQYCDAMADRSSGHVYGVNIARAPRHVTRGPPSGQAALRAQTSQSIYMYTCISSIVSRYGNSILPLSFCELVEKSFFVL